MKTCPEVIEQFGVCLIPQGTRSWVEAGHQIEAHDASEPRERHEGNLWSKRALDPAHLRIRHSRRTGDHIDAETATDSRRSELGSDLNQRRASQAHSPVDLPFSRGHGSRPVGALGDVG
jgi:hypothetical protein